MIVVRVAGALLAAVVGWFVAVRFGSPVLPRVIDPFLVVVVLFALRSGPAGGQVVGAVGGLVHDAVTGGPFGLHGFAGTVVGFAVSASAHRVMVQQRAIRILVFAAAAAVEQALVALLLVLLSPVPDTPDPLWSLARVAGTAILGGIVMAVVRSGGRRWRRWRSSRARQLRFR